MILTLRMLKEQQSRLQERRDLYLVPPNDDIDELRRQQQLQDLDALMPRRRRPKDPRPYWQQVAPEGVEFYPNGTNPGPPWPPVDPNGPNMPIFPGGTIRPGRNPDGSPTNKPYPHERFDDYDFELRQRIMNPRWQVRPTEFA